MKLQQKVQTLMKLFLMIENKQELWTLKYNVKWTGQGNNIFFNFVPYANRRVKMNN